MTTPEVMAKPAMDDAGGLALDVDAQDMATAPILALPNELIGHVVRKLSTGARLAIDDLRSLSLVHSRFLPFTRPLVLSSVDVTGSDRLLQIVSECKSAAPGLGPDQHIRFISVADYRNDNKAHSVTESDLASLLECLPFLEGIQISRYWLPITAKAVAAALNKLDRLVFLSVTYQQTFGALSALRPGSRLRTYHVNQNRGFYDMLEGEPVDIQVDAFVGDIQWGAVTLTTLRHPAFARMRAVTLSHGLACPENLEKLADTLEALGIVGGQLSRDCYAVSMPRLVLFGFVSGPRRLGGSPLTTSAQLIRNVKRLLGPSGLPPNLGPEDFPELDTIAVDDSPSADDAWIAQFASARPHGWICSTDDLPQHHGGKWGADLLAILDQMKAG